MALTYLSGAETGTMAGEAWVSNANINVVSSVARKDPSGEGGNYSFRFSTAGLGSVHTGPIVPQMRECWIAHGVRIEGHTGGVGLGVGNIATGIGWNVRINGNGTVDLFADSSSTVQASAVAAIVPDQWYLVETHFVEGAPGLIEVYVDSALVLTHSATISGPWDRLYGRYLRVSGSETSYIDDIRLHVPTIAYDTGVGGTADSGDTVTGTTSGATGTVTDSLDGSTATEGRLVLFDVTGTFIDGEAITTTAGTGTLNAAVHAPTAAYAGGLEPNSGRPGNGYVVYLRPTDVGNTSQLTPVGAATGWQATDNVPVTSGSDYVETNVPGEYDTYQLADLPASAVTVKGVFGYAYASRDGEAIINLRSILRLGATDYTSPDLPLPTAYQSVTYEWLVNPDTGALFTPADINAAEAGPRLES